MGKLISEHTKTQILQYHTSGSTPVEIATQMKLSLRTVEIVLVRSGRILDNSPRGKAKASVVAQRKRAAWLKGQGWSLEQIQNATKLSGKEIEANWKKWAEKYGIVLPEPTKLPEPGMNGPVITYRMVDGKLVKEESRINPVTDMIVSSEYAIMDELNPVTEEYRKMLEEGAFIDG